MSSTADPNPTANTTPAVAFAAKSTRDTRGSNEGQLEDCRKMAEDLEIELAGREYQDEDESAYHSNRGLGLVAAMAECERLAAEHGTCTLLIQHSDRLARGDGRRAEHLLHYALWALKHNIKIVSKQDLKTFDDLVYTAIEGHRNHEDSERKSSAVKDGMQRMAKRGQPNGGPRPFGYLREAYVEDNEPKWRLVKDEPEAVIARRIFADFIGGISQWKITKALNAEEIPALKGGQWHQGTIANILKNPLYVGQFSFKGETYDSNHPAIIDNDTWTKAQQLLSANATGASKGRGRNPKGGHLFTKALLVCGRCGSAMDAITKPTRTPGQTYEVYACSGRRRHQCSQTPVKRDLIDSAVWTFFERVALDVDATRRAITEQTDAKLSQVSTLVQQAQREVATAQERLDRVRRDYTNGDLTAAEWRELREELESDLEAAQASAARLEKQRQALVSDHAEVDVESVLVREMTALRAMVAGEVQDASRRGVDALRSALRRLFDHFELIVWPGFGMSDEKNSIVWGGEIPTVEGEDVTMVLLPHVRPDVIETDAAEFPAMRRVALDLGAKNYAERLGR